MVSAEVSIRVILVGVLERCVIQRWPSVLCVCLEARIGPRGKMFQRDDGIDVVYSRD